MDDVDLQLNFAMCFDHFQHNESTKDEQYKTPLNSKDNSPNNESESIEVVETPSNPYKGPLQESTISSASTNNTDICVLDSHYANDDLHFSPDDNIGEQEFLESEEGDEVFLRAVDVSDGNGDFTLLRKPVKSRRLCNCDESTEVLMLINSEYHGKHKPTYSGTDSDVEVLMSEEVFESDWSSGNNDHKDEKSLTFETEPDRKYDEGVSSNNQLSTDSEISCAELDANSENNKYAHFDRAQLLQIIQQQEERIQALEATVEQYHKAQEKLFEHVDALRLELNEIRITPTQKGNANKPVQ